MPLPLRLAGFYFAFFVYAGAFVAYFPPYLEARGLSAPQIAWVLALPHVARVVAPAAWGWLADRSGAHRGIVVFSCVANAACFGTLPWVDGAAAVAGLVGATSLLSAAALPLVEAITLTALASEPGRYGPIRLWGSFGFIAGVLAVGAWLDLRAADTLPAVLFGCCALSIAAALLLPAQRLRPAPAAAGAAMPPAAALVIAAGFFMAAAHGTLYTFFSLHLQHEGYGGAVIGLFWTLGVLAEIAVFFWLPALFRRYALSTLLVASFACAVLRFVAIGWGAGFALVLFFAQLLHAATFGSFHAASVAAVQRSFPEHAQGRGQTLFTSLAYGAGGATGAVLAGWSWSAAGPAMAFTISSLVAAAGLFLVRRLKRHGI